MPLECANDDTHSCIDVESKYMWDKNSKISIRIYFQALFKPFQLRANGIGCLLVYEWRSTVAPVCMVRSWIDYYEVFQLFISLSHEEPHSLYISLNSCGLPQKNAHDGAFSAAEGDPDG